MTALKPAVHIAAVIGIADSGIEFRQTLSIGRIDTLQLSEPCENRIPVDRHPYTPHRSPAVNTGSSHSETSSSSARSSVIEQPAISRLVM